MTASCFDVVMPVAPNNRHVLAWALRSLAVNAAPRRVYLITTRGLMPDLIRLPQPDLDIRLLDEDAMIDGVTLAGLQDYLRGRGVQPGRAGWYLQQFAKMAAASQPEIADDYLIWDSDTVLLRPTAFFDSAGVVQFAARAKRYEPYRQAYRRLLGHDPAAEVSFVAEHMMVCKIWMRELITAIEERQGQRWVWAIMDVIDTPELSHSGFSEFETYANFMLAAHPDAAAINAKERLRSGAWLYGLSPNRFDLCRLSQKYEIASFEHWNQGRLWRIAAEKSLARMMFISYKTRRRCPEWLLA
ncbi:MAG: hypothetical protein J5I90_12465 [Caldilineales bacterium]|nr:hypothetical protein [Caldilineales bacterium]